MPNGCMCLTGIRGARVAQLTTMPSAELPLKYQWLVQGALSYTLECTAATTNNSFVKSAATEDTVTALRLGRYVSKVSSGSECF
jgi:hypothetical protein